MNQISDRAGIPDPFKRLPWPECDAIDDAGGFAPRAESRLAHRGGVPIPGSGPQAGVPIASRRARVPLAPNGGRSERRGRASSCAAQPAGWACGWAAARRRSVTLAFIAFCSFSKARTSI